MANISIQDVEKVAKLSNLEFGKDEMQKFTDSFTKIIGFVEKIGELDTEDVLPTTHAVPKKNVIRADEVKPSFTGEEIQAVAPKFIDGNIVVTKVIEY